MAQKRPKRLSRKRIELTVSAALAAIKENVERLVTSDDWKSLLEVMSLFHTYSLHNMILISVQRPDASQVAGKKTWEKLGRKVKPGAQPIQILAPRVIRGKKGEPLPVAEITSWKGREPLGKMDRYIDEEPEREPDVFLGGFRASVVFAAEDTTGKPLPGAASLVEYLQGEDAAASWVVETLTDWLQGNDVVLRYESGLGKVGGYYDAEKRLIVVNKERSPVHQAKVLAHEVAHLLLHTPEELATLSYQHKHGRHDVTRNAQEVEAESTAFVVLRALGVESGRYSFGYVATWAKGDTKLVEETATRVRDVATYLLTDVLTLARANPTYDPFDVVGFAELPGFYGRRAAPGVLA